MTPYGAPAAIRHCVVADALTDLTLTELDLAVDTCQRRIIVPGVLRASYPITSPAAGDEARKIVAGRTVIHVMRDVDIWGSYLIWHAEPAMDDQGHLTLQLQGASLESYPYRRKIRADLTYADVDQIEIARQLLTHMAARPEGDMGLALMGGLSGTLRDRTYRASESATYGERLEQLANVIGGFEYMIRTRIDTVTGQRVREWVWATRLGSPGIVRDITQPGVIKSWSYPEDATQAATAWQTRGDTIQDDLSAASEPLMSDVYEDTARLAAGWPLLDRTEDYSSVRRISTLNAHAEQLRDTRSGSVSIPRITVHFDDAFSIDPNYLGDTARFTLVNDWFPLSPSGAPTFSRAWRIVGMDIKPPTSDDGEERAELIFEEA
ncbi:hypothetical protein FHS43_000576 [Streptosporangium becharense]|uniref:Minor tail protein n=1 Tax=Streptosporangium becharense TaxID=1816182 RepID=A0A7W9MJY4_9ACTN|nr:hypothetical protein [Streptosporangium becharense]MBB2909330.1 hypothetical protein [Streptosporangium becharense]MBB5823767.1 hypothetical protein [Streptosporangium becharense]